MATSYSSTSRVVILAIVSQVKLEMPDARDGLQQRWSRPMDADFGYLQGRTLRRTDCVDEHRWRAYQRFFDLAIGESPLAFHWLLFNEFSTPYGPDGNALPMEPFPRLPFPRRMWAGAETTWLAPFEPGMRLTRTSVITRAQLKSGHGDFLLASLEHVIEGECGRCLRERQDVVFLAADHRTGAAAPR